MYTIDWEIEGIKDIEVGYEVSGTFRRATHWDPEEYPEVDIVSLKVRTYHDKHNPKEDIWVPLHWDALNEDMQDEIRQACQDNIEQAQEDARADAAELKYDMMREDGII